MWRLELVARWRGLELVVRSEGDLSWWRELVEASAGGERLWRLELVL